MPVLSLGDLNEHTLPFNTNTGHGQQAGKLAEAEAVDGASLSQLYQVRT